MYRTPVGHYAREDEEEKVRQRMEVVAQISRRGCFLELFAGKGFLSRLYAKYAEKLILVDSNESYLKEAEKKINGLVPYEIYCKDNILFIKEDLPRIAESEDIVYVDFDAFGCPSPQIFAFFSTFKVKRPLWISITDGSGLHMGYVSRDWNKYFSFIDKMYRVKRLKWERANVALYQHCLLVDLGVKYGFTVKKINQAVRRKGFPVYMGFYIEPASRNV